MTLYLDFALSSPERQKAAIETFQSDLRSLLFDPQAKPTFIDGFAYSMVDLTHFKASGAVAGFEIARDRVKLSDDPGKWRGIVDDELAIAFAMLLKSPKQIQAACEKAIVRNPTYPGPYLLLAKMSAEAGNPVPAQNRLQEAFDRRANKLPGEIFPDPTNDLSFQKLKDNKTFWAFVEGLSKQLK